MKKFRKMKALRERIEEYIEIKNLKYLVLTSIMGVGGGIAHFLFFSTCCLYASRINKPLFWE
jgi:hypothetical protein